MTLHFILSAMDGKIEQCACIKFCVKLGKAASKTLKMFCEAFGEHSLSRTVVFELHSHFKAGQMSVQDDKHSGRPSKYDGITVYIPMGSLYTFPRRLF
jgi:hypothetical protein